MSKNINVTVLVKQDHVLSEVADALVKNGFTLSNTLHTIKVLTGSALDTEIDNLRSVNGVHSIAEERCDYHACNV